MHKIVHFVVGGAAPVKSFAVLSVFSNTLPLGPCITYGNWSHVDVALNSLNKLLNDILITIPSCVVTSIWNEKYLFGIGLNNK